MKKAILILSKWQIGLRKGTLSILRPNKCNVWHCKDSAQHLTSTISGLSSGFGFRHLNERKSVKIIPRTANKTNRFKQNKRTFVDHESHVHTSYLVTVSDTLLEYRPEGMGSYWASTICATEKKLILLNCSQSPCFANLKPLTFLPFSLPSPSWMSKTDRKDLRTATAVKTSLKKWIRVLSIFIAITPSHWLCQMQAIPPKVEFLTTISKFRKREEISSSLVCFLCTSWN